MESDLNNSLATDEALKALHGHLTLSIKNICSLTPWNYSLNNTKSRPKRQTLFIATTIAFLITTSGHFLATALNPTLNTPYTSYQKVTTDHIYELSISLNHNIRNTNSLLKNVAINSDIMHTSLIVHILLDELNQFMNPSSNSPIARALLSNAKKHILPFIGVDSPPPSS